MSVGKKIIDPNSDSDLVDLFNLETLEDLQILLPILENYYYLCPLLF